MKLIALLLAIASPCRPLYICTETVSYCAGHVYRGGACAGPVITYCVHVEELWECK